MVYFNDTVAGGGNDGDWSNANNWWSDSSWTVPFGSIPDQSYDVQIDSNVTADSNGLANSPGVKSAVFRNGNEFDSNVQGLYLTVVTTATFYGAGGCGGNINGSAIFHDTCQLFTGSVFGDATFYDYSVCYYTNNLTGTAYFYNNSSAVGPGNNSTASISSAVFSQNAFASGAGFNGTAYFQNNSYSVNSFYNGLAIYVYPATDNGNNIYNTIQVQYLGTPSSVSSNGTIYVSPSGNDSTGLFNDPAHPFKTAQAALNLAMPYCPPTYAGHVYRGQMTTHNCVIQFAAGTISDYGNLDVCGDWTSNVQIKGAGSSVTFLGDIVGRNGADDFLDVANDQIPPTNGIGISITSDASITIGNITSGIGGGTPNQTQETYSSGNGGGIVISHIICGVVTGGNGGSGQPNGNVGGNGGSVTISSSSIINGGKSGDGGICGGDGPPSGNGGDFSITNSISNSSVYGGNGGEGVDGNGGGKAGTLSIISSTIQGNAIGGSGGNGNGPQLIGCGGGNGGSVVVTSSNISGYISGGSAGSQISGSFFGAGANGGNVTITSSTFLTPVYAGLGGSDLYGANPPGQVGTVTVNGSTPYFGYPATQAVLYIGDKDDGWEDWAYIPNWRDSNGNYASILPSSSTNITISGIVRNDSSSSATCNNATVTNGAGFDCYNNITLSVVGLINFQSNSVFNVCGQALLIINGNVKISGGIASSICNNSINGNLLITTPSTQNFMQSNSSGSYSISIKGVKKAISLTQLLRLPFVINI